MKASFKFACEKARVRKNTSPERKKLPGPVLDFLLSRSSLHLGPRFEGKSSPSRRVFHSSRIQVCGRALHFEIHFAN